MKQRALFDVPKTRKIPAKRGQPRKVKRTVTTKVDENILSFINRRERQILLHSYMYYDLDKPVIEDNVFDKWSYELFELMKTHEAEFKKSAFYSEFKHFDGSTGMDLPYRQPFTMKQADILLRGMK